MAAAQILPRLASPTLYGSDHAPAPVLLSPLPGDLLGRAGLLDDAAMDDQVAALEYELQTTLRPTAGAMPPPLPEQAVAPVVAEAVVPPQVQAPAMSAETLSAAPAFVNSAVEDAIAPETPFAVDEEEAVAEEEEEQADWVDLDAGRAGREA